MSEFQKKMLEDLLYGETSGVLSMFDQELYEGNAEIIDVNRMAVMWNMEEL